MERTEAQEKRWQTHKKMLDKVGWEGKVLARQIGISPIALYQRFRRMKVRYVQEKKIYTDKIKVIRAVHLRQAMVEVGFDMRKLAEKLGMDEKLVRIRAGRLGIFKESPKYMNYPARLNLETRARMEEKIKQIEAEKGVRISIAETIRAGLEFMSEMSNERIFMMCMRERGKTWRLRHRPRTKR